MVPTIQILILLLIIVASVAVVAARVNVPPSILLVLTGVALALVPGLPTLELSPELVRRHDIRISGGAQLRRRRSTDPARPAERSSEPTLHLGCPAWSGGGLFRHN
jgi:hypothetical protein